MTEACTKVPPVKQTDPSLSDASLADTLCRLFGSLSESLLRSDRVAGDQGAVGTPHAAYGVKSTQGQRPNMEDSYAVQEKLASPAALAAGPAACKSPLEQPTPDAPACPSDKDRELFLPFLPCDLAFFSVYDGHGGDSVAQHCSQRLHKAFASELCLARMQSRATVSDPAGCASPRPIARSGEEGPCEGVRISISGRSAFSDSPEALDSLVASSMSTSLQPLSSELVCAALQAAFQKTDEELAGTEDGEFVGATAVVAVVGKERIWVAHCGDSRAVIQRGGEAEALTRDHKPERADEAARIKAAGGRIVYNSGSHRVMGMLAMSRAIGDHFLRPYVIAAPEVTCVPRTVRDEVLVIATDGLWDVFSCKEATTLASRCIVRSKERGMSRHGACRVAASVLTKVALERGSRDNITVIVIDITLPTEEEVAEGAGTAGVPSSAQPAEQAAPDATGGSGKFPKSSSVGNVFLLKSQAQASKPKSLTSGAGPGAAPPEDGVTVVRRRSIDRTRSAPREGRDVSPQPSSSPLAAQDSGAGRGAQRKLALGAMTEGEVDDVDELQDGGLQSSDEDNVVSEGEDAGQACSGDEEEEDAGDAASAESEDAASAECTSVLSGSSIASLTAPGVGVYDSGRVTLRKQGCAFSSTDGSPCTSSPPASGAGAGELAAQLAPGPSKATAPTPILPILLLNVVASESGRGGLGTGPPLADMAAHEAEASPATPVGGASV